MLASNRLAGTYSHQDSRPGATRLEVGPRESRAGSRVPRHTSSSPAVQATCQGGAVHAPGAPPGGGPHPTHKCKHHAPRWPSTLPRSGYARAQAEALCSALVINNLGRPHGRTNLREPRAQRPASPRRLPSGESREGARNGGRARVTPKRTPPNQVPRTWASRAPPEASARAGMEIVCTSRGTPKHRDSGA